MAKPEERQALAQVRERLAISFPDVPAQRVSEIVTATTDTFALARVRDFVPLLVEKAARDRLAKSR